MSSEEEQGIYRVAVLISHPDLSLGNDDIGYVVEFEPLEGDGQVGIRFSSNSL